MSNGTKVIVRPKARALPRMEVWVIQRKCPITRITEEWEVTCVEGTCLDFYRKLGIDRDGVEFDPIEDLAAGRLKRRRIRSFR